MPTQITLELLAIFSDDVPEFAAPDGPYDSPGLARDVVIEDHYAYVLQGADGPAGTEWGRLAIVNVSDPTAPVLVGSFATEWIATDVAISDELAYLTASDCEFGMAACAGMLYVLDVSDPRTPKKLGTYPLYSAHGGFVEPSSWFAAGVAVQGNYAYVTGGTFYPLPAGNECGLRAIDITKPELPVIAGALLCIANSETWPGHSLVVAGEYIYVAGGESGLHIINATSPNKLIEVGNIRKTSQVKDVAVQGDLAYLTTDEFVVWIVDISDPTAPTTVAVLKTESPGLNVAVEGEFAFVATGNDGLRVLDVSEPANPTELGFYDSSGFVEGVAVLNGYVYVADEMRGLLILKYVPPHDPQTTGNDREY